MDFVNKIIQGDTLEIPKQLPADTFDTIITSPPYWGLRDYGVEGQIGLEATLEEFLEKMLAITLELKRVFKPTGVMWWNHGDCYSGGGVRFDQVNLNIQREGKDYEDTKGFERLKELKRPKVAIPTKSLCLQNYRLILKMIDDQGWILRNTIIWHKPNYMPSSVKDRFANSYEPLFILTKKKKYWFDLDAVRVAHKETTIESGRQLDVERVVKAPNPAGKNPGDVWKIATQPFPQAHFATFPEKLVTRPILASCPKEICKKCGKARVRMTKQVRTKEGHSKTIATRDKGSSRNFGGMRWESHSETIGWTDCGCNAGFGPGIVLDPFMGSGTVGVVAKRFNRKWCGIELNPEYIKIAKQRIRGQVRAML